MGCKAVWDKTGKPQDCCVSCHSDEADGYAMCDDDEEFGEICCGAWRAIDEYRKAMLTFEQQEEK
jgi:hypothetical protein